MVGRFADFLYIFVFFNCFENDAIDACQIEGRDFKILADNSPWQVWNGSFGSLTISLCKALSFSPCGENSSICYHDGVTQIYRNFGNLSSIVLNASELVRPFSIQLQGEKCSMKEYQLTTLIYFKCGKSLGYPVLVPSSNCCRLVLEWETTVACAKDSKLSQSEVTKCYDHSSHNLLINLNTLDGEYEVEAGDDDDHDDDDGDNVADVKGDILKIAVCRNMESDESCPGLGACLIHNGTKMSLGRISGGPTFMAGGRGTDHLTITYTDHVSHGAQNYPIAMGCDNITTTIKFSCPERGIGSSPILVSGFSDCNFTINWETEAACPLESIESSGSCRLTSRRQAIDIDFTSLALVGPKVVNVTDEIGDLVSYELLVCSNKTIQCGSFNSSACQKNLNNHNIKSIGNFSSQTFRYFDGVLQMILKGGEPCGTGFSRNTIINFHCNRTAIGGGDLSFAYEDMCTYVFDWNASVACFVPSVPCTLKRGDVTFDLSKLIKTKGEDNWRSAENSTILNVCRGLVTTNLLEERRCAASTAICRKSGSEYRNHGSKVLAPRYNVSKGAIELNYLEGDQCPNGKYRTATLFLFCDPNVENSQPYLVGISQDDCHLDLEWRLSAACGQGHIVGRECIVGDPITGLQFDLSALRLTGSKNWYNVSTPDYDYLINICAPLVGAPCSQSDTGVCQVSKNLQHVHSTGRWNEEPHYSNGALRLTYRNGDNYNSQPPVPRHTDMDFVCDRGAGLGEPRFVVETNRTYKFVWLTVLACPTDSEKCSSFVASSGESYDLSRLVRLGVRKNWEMTASVEGKSYKLLLNLCRHLLVGPEIEKCNPLHSACLISLDDEEVISLGRSFRAPSIDGEEVVLNYERGGECMNSSRYSLEIRLHCNATNDQAQPWSVEKISACKFRVHWSTSSACPGKSKDHGSDDRNTSHDFGDDNCTIKLDAPDQTLDISNYTGRSFEVQDGIDTFKIAICGKSPECGGNSTACRVVGGRVEESTKLDGRKLSLGSDGMPQLQLFADKLKILVEFKCDPNSSGGRISLNGRRSDWLLITFSTPAACFSRTMPCVAFDEEGNRYDLEPLSKTGGGKWTATNTHGDFVDFNLCSSLAMGSVNPCTSAGSCIIKNGSKAGENGGYVASNLEATGKGSLRLRYLGGSTCQNGKRSTTILLQCNAMQHSPMLMTAFEECESLVQWNTPFACFNKKVTGVGCRVAHPTYPSQIFDLSPLREGGDREIDFDVGKFFVGVCSEVHGNKECRDIRAGGCFVVGSDVYSMGTYNDLLQYEDGKLSLIYSASISNQGNLSVVGCNESRVSTRIDFLCEHDNLGISSGPVYITGTCNRKFELVTSLACFEYRKIKCSVEDKNGPAIDLSHLTLHDSNYEVVIHGGKTKFLINVCSTLVHTAGNSCPPDASACKIDLVTEKSTSIGSIPGRKGGNDATLVLQGDKTVMTYKAEGATTIIYFLCDDQSPLETTAPRFLDREGDDIYIFVWNTRLACHQKNRYAASGCSVLDPDTNHRYNLSSLQTSNPHRVVTKGQIFNVLACPPGNLLTYEHGSILQRYSGGQVCDDGKNTSSTLVIFLCVWNDKEEGIEFVMKNDACLHVFRWKTKLACKNELSCVVRGGDGVSLSSLVRHEGGYEVDASLFKNTVEGVVVNICSDLLEERGCKGDHAVCIKMHDGTYRKGGSVLEDPLYDKSTREISIVYKGGDLCQSGSWSSKILFVCSQVHHANPSLISINKTLCLYTFEWKTNFVCMSSYSNSTFSTIGCKMSVEGDTYDISSVGSSLESKHIASKTGSLLKIQLCSNFDFDPCTSSVVCLFLNGSRHQVRGFGSRKRVISLREGKDLKLFFQSDKEIMLNGSAVIIFICDPSQTVPDIQILHEGDLEVIFSVKTRATCESSASSSSPHFTEGPDLLDATHRAQSGRNFTTLYVILSVILACSIFVIVGIFIRRKRRRPRGYEPVDTMHYRDYDDDMQSPLFGEEETSQPILQNYTSDDDLML